MVVGLGNPGAEFAGSLHNAGSDTVELLAQRHGTTLRGEKGVAARVATATIGGRLVALAVPTTYMNESGLAVRGLARRFGLERTRRRSSSSTTSWTSRRARSASRPGVGWPATTGFAPSRRTSAATTSSGCASAWASRRVAAQGAAHVLRRPPRAVRELMEEGARWCQTAKKAADSVERVIAADGMDAAMLWCHSLPLHH